MCLYTISILRTLATVMAVGPFFPCAATDETAANKIPPVATSKKTFPGSALFDEAILSENVIAVRDQASRLPDSERFNYLVRWVFGAESQATIRMGGAFTQADPAPVTLNPVVKDDTSGGILVSPFFDLLDLAAKTRRLPELRDRAIAISDLECERVSARCGA